MSHFRTEALLTYMDQQTHARIATVDPATGQIIGDTDTGLVLHEIGSPACERGSGGRCTVPMATSGVNGPCLGWVLGHVDAGRSYVVESDRSYCFHSLSSSDLTRDMSINGSLGYLGIFNDASSGAFVYHLPSAT